MKHCRMSIDINRYSIRRILARGNNSIVISFRNGTLLTIGSTLSYVRYVEQIKQHFVRRKDTVGTRCESVIPRPWSRSTKPLTTCVIRNCTKWLFEGQLNTCVIVAKPINDSCSLPLVTGQLDARARRILDHALDLGIESSLPGLLCGSRCP